MTLARTVQLGSAMKTNSIKRGMTVTSEQIAALGDVDLDGDKATVAGYAFSVSPHSEEWICRDVPPTKEETQRAILTELARKAPWHEFVCAYVAAHTRRKVEGYTVRPSAKGYAIRFGGVAMVDRDPSTVYSWFERLPLVTLSREADRFRDDVLTGAHAAFEARVTALYAGV